MASRFFIGSYRATRNGFDNYFGNFNTEVIGGYLNREKQIQLIATEKNYDPDKILLCDITELNESDFNDFIKVEK